MNIIAICGSSYQVLVLNKILDENYKNDSVTLVLLDTIAQVEDLYYNAREEKKFSKVWLWRVKDKFKFTKVSRVYQCVMGWRASLRIMQPYINGKEKYDVLLYSNNSPIVLHVMNVLSHNNSDIVFEMFEDGFSTYSDYIGNFFASLKKISKFSWKIFRKTSMLYVFNEQIMGWKPEFEVKNIGTSFSEPCRERINRIFSYDELIDDYRKKIIFFEESYAADGKMIDDIELLEHISKIVGKENIIVKIHPRNPTNRFAEKGYITNTNISIPWEVIVLNLNCKSTIFITMASNAAMNPFFLFGKKNRAILLFKCTSYSESLYAPIVAFDNKLCSQYPEVFAIPSDISEVDKYI